MHRRADTDLMNGLLTGLLGLLVLGTVPAYASLGGAESTAAADARNLGGSIKSTGRLNYRVHEITLPSGTTLREFASLSGTVFAVAWKGPVIPDLKQALGAYFDTFSTAAQAPHRGHRHLEIRQDDFVMQSTGHMRAFSGHAYLPSALPSGVSPEELF